MMAQADNQTPEAGTPDGGMPDAGTPSPAPCTPVVLQRTLGLWGAVYTGLGAIVGTGVFVSLALAAESSGPALPLVVLLAGLLALCNGLSSAQLAACHPVSGGTYEYGHRFLHPTAGFLAGWCFVCAKSASAATAALGFAGYGLDALRLEGNTNRVAVALVAVVVLTAVVLGGLRRSYGVNLVIVSLALLSLALFVLCGLPAAVAHTDRLWPATEAAAQTGWPAWTGLLHATALVFVAYTGYGRIATLGEEVREPARTIPRAILATLAVTALLYAGVAVAGLGIAGAAGMVEAVAEGGAPLERLARQAGGAAWGPWIARAVALGAVAAMLGVLLNLILGVSRVLLAMGRRGDLPPAVARLNQAGTTPPVAVVLTGLIIAGLACAGSLRLTWSFSAFTVLLYYGMTNLCALALPVEARRFPRAFAWAGLIGCLGLAFFVDWRVWAVGLGVLALGLLWHLLARRLFA